MHIYVEEMKLERIDCVVADQIKADNDRIINSDDKFDEFFDKVCNSLSLRKPWED